MMSLFGSFVIKQTVQMVGTVLVFFSVLAFLTTLFFLCICVGGTLGLLSITKKYLARNIALSHDRVYEHTTEPINNECFICLQPISNQVVATCNHSYCGQCIASYIQSNQNRIINCPACRKEILILFRRFQPHNDQQHKLKDFISQYNSKFTQQPSILRALGEFGNTLKNLPILFTSSGLSYLLGDSRLKYVILYAIYTFSPIDLLPEAFLGPIGLLDDGMVVAGMIRQISSILYGFVREEAVRQQ